MNIDGIRINKEVSGSVIDALQGAAESLAAGEGLLFVIVGDLTPDSAYGTNYLCATENRIFSTDADGRVQAAFAYDELQSATVKRLYGNACLRVTDRTDAVHDIFRFTYAVSDLCDMAADYLTARIEGEDPARAFEAVDASFEKAMRVCPHCGRRLLHAGADCISCQSKGKIASKLLVYFKPELKNLLLCLVLSIAATALNMLQPTMTASLVDDVLPNNDLALLQKVILLLLGARILQHGIGVIRSYRLRYSAANMVSHLRNSIFAKAQKLSMRFYDKTTTGAVINRINGDSTTIEQFMVRLSQEVVVQFFTLVGIMFIMFAMNWRLAVVTLLPIPFIVVGTRIFGKKIQPYYRRNWRRWTNVVSTLTDIIPAVRLVKSFSAEERSTERFRRANDAWLANDRRSSRISTAFPNIVNFFVNLGSLLIWCVGGAWVIYSNLAEAGQPLPGAVSLFGGTVTLGTLVAFISYASMFYTPVNFFANLNDSYQSALSSAERILDILDAEEEPDCGKDNRPEIAGKIEFQNVNFSFDRAKMTLHDISFTIEKGDVVGIVGTTGAGKSTLVNLLMRFYDGYEGKILVDGRDIRDIDLSYYRSKIGYVQQDSMMFRDTVYNNIAFSKPDATVEEVFNAADIANAHEFIARLPDEYDSMLGERGIGLSGGERQRLSIARTVLMNPEILIFDEATASVDSETESQIQGAIEALISGRTTIMIAHRLSTLRKANKIIVLDKGGILEMGTPEELLAKKGKYYKLIQIQTMTEKAQAEKEEENL